MSLCPYMILVAFITPLVAFASGCFWGADSAQTPAATPTPDLSSAQIPSLTSQPSTSSNYTPIATPIVDSIAKFHVPCYGGGFGQYPLSGALRGKSLQWSTDGSRILFDFRSWFLFGPMFDDIYAVDVDGSTLRRIAETIPQRSLGSFRALSGPPTTAEYSGYRVPYHGPMTHFDISPDGSRVVYSSCVYPGSGGNDPFSPSYSEHDDYGYEIVISNIDGTDPKRLTENRRFDNYPVWSPDGAHIAFISGRKQIIIYTLATADSLGIRLSMNESFLLHPLSWSPDGSRIAFVMYEESSRPWFSWKPVVYTVKVDGYGLEKISDALYKVGSDGSGLTRISETMSSPSWSPDGHRIALISPGSNENDGYGILYTFAADGSDPIILASQEVESPLQWLGMVSWSPDGSEILVDGLSLRLSVDGSSVNSDRPLAFRSHDILGEEEFSAWSPDGSKIAILIHHDSVRQPQSEPNLPVLYTMDRDGTDPRVLVRYGQSLVAENSRWEDVSAGILSCSQGFVVPEPDKNTGLVEDCRTLIGLRDTLTGGNALNWNTDTPIDQWDGVTVESIEMPSHRLMSRSRVTMLRLGTILPPASFGESENLYSLESFLRVSYYSNGNLSTGVIPSELGNLVGLRELSLIGDFTGVIPSELGNLVGLRVLRLGGGLTGSIPSELGNLVNLRFLDLEGNRFTGCVPMALVDKIFDFDRLGLPPCEQASDGR